MDPRVVAELQSLVANINPLTGITGSFDYDRCVEMFERLQAAAVPFDAEPIRGWLSTTGKLKLEDANAVGKMAAKFLAGTKVRHREDMVRRPTVPVPLR